MQLSKFIQLAFVMAVSTLGLASLSHGQSAPPPPVPLNLDGASLPPLLEGVDIENKLNAQVPLDVTFVNAAGDRVELSEILDGGRPVVLQCGYFNCPSLCGAVMNGMLEVMKESSLQVGEDYDVISLSINHDEGPELATMKKQNYVAALGQQEGSAGWHFLTGTESDIRRVTDAVGFGYRYVPSKNEYAHAAALILLTPEGKVSRYLFGVKYDPFTYEQSLVEASNGEIGSVWNKFLMTCFVYDETAGQYNWAAMGLMRMAGALTVLVMVLVVGVLFIKGSIVQKRAATAT